MNTEQTSTARRADLDALRAVAMLLGIVLHAALSFSPSFWVVSDSRQSEGFAILVAAIHGFRMPLFFVMCGYFSALLLRRRGRGALVRHRFARVVLPLLLGLVTVVPATNWISGVGMASRPSKGDVASSMGGAGTIWGAAYAGDLAALDRHLADGLAVDGRDPGLGGTPLLWAALGGRAGAIERLVRGGADVNALDRDGSTGLHAAAFLGHDAAVAALIDQGARVDLANRRGETPLDLAEVDEGTTRYFCSLLGLPVEPDGLAGRKAAVAESLRKVGATAGRRGGVAELLMQIPLFSHLWFLWFLWWLVLGYALVSAVVDRFPRLRLPEVLVRAPGCYLWLIPLTMIPQWFMGDVEGFGPDTSAGLLPIPRVFAYYAIFFGFGTLLFEAEDRSGVVVGRWWASLALAVLVVLPAGLALAERSAETPEGPYRLASVAVQAAYPWLMTFGLMGLFRRFFPAENPTWRYLSDSAYWLYLAHLPLVIAAQYLVRDWPVPAVLKFVLIVATITPFLLWTYGAMVRQTWIGRLLNGRRAPARESAPAVGSARLSPDA